MRSSSEAVRLPGGPSVRKRRVNLAVVAVIAATMVVSAALTADHAELASATRDHSSVMTLPGTGGGARDAHSVGVSTAGLATTCVGGDLVLVTCSVVTTVSPVLSPSKARPAISSAVPLCPPSVIAAFPAQTAWAHADQPDCTALGVIRT